jgi:hypothetical protein
MFNLTITTYSKNLGNLKAILEKAKAWQTAQKINDETIMNARLALDQFNLAAQVRSTTNFAKSTAAALCAVEAPVFEDNEKTLSDLQDRIDKVIAFLGTLTPDMVKDDLETRIIPLAWMPGKGLVARYFLEVYAHSNFYFHYTTAYSILRHYGLAIGKADYMGQVEIQDLPK